MMYPNNLLPANVLLLPSLGPYDILWRLCCDAAILTQMLVFDLHSYCSASKALWLHSMHIPV